MATVTCTTADCAENGIPKDLGTITLYQDERVSCGQCGQPITVPPEIRTVIETRGPLPRRPGT